MGKIRTLQAHIDRTAQESSKEPWFPGGSIDLDYESGKGFRVESCGSWGDGFVYVSDGKTLLSDPLDLTQGVTLKGAKPAVFDNDPSLAMRGGSFSLLYYFLAGAKGFDEAVSKDGEIVGVQGGPNRDAIRFKSTKIGTVTVFFNPKDRHLLVQKIAFDDLENKKEQAKMFAEWGAEMPTDPLDVQQVTYASVNRRLRRNVFSTEPAKGLVVNDQRKKAKAP